MKLSEKYLARLISDFGGGTVESIADELKLYGEICALEAQQTLLVSNPSTFPQERYIDKLSEIVSKLEEIKTNENL